MKIKKGAYRIAANNSSIDDMAKINFSYVTSLRAKALLAFEVFIVQEVNQFNSSN